MTRKPNFWKCLMGVVVLALLFVATWASTNALKSSAHAVAQKQGPTVNAPPTPTPTPGAVPAGIAHVFELEGNVCNDAAEGTDWNDVNPSTDPACTPGFVTGDPDGPGPIQLATFVIDTCPDDRVFTIGSSKDFNDIAGNWHSTTGSVPDKDEITHAYAAISVVPTTAATTADGTAGHRILTFGGDRFATNGDANIGLWFFQNAVGIDPATGDFTGTHLNGDLFVVSAFTGGGGTSTIDVYEWVGSPLSGAAALCSGLGGTLDNAGTLCKLPATQNKGFGVVNPAALTGSCPGGGGLDWPYTTKGGADCLTGPCTAPKGSFYEGGLDLSTLGFANTCFSTFLLETRSSATVDAILKDFALGSFDTCALEVTKTPATQSICEGGTAHYDFTVHNAGVSTLFVTVVDDGGTPNNTADDFDAVTGVLVSADPGGVPQEITINGGVTVPSCGPGVPAPCLFDRNKTFLAAPNPNPEVNIVTAKGRLTSGGSIVKTATASASVTVNTPPTCAITGTNIICHFSPTGTTNTTEFCGPAGMATYAWTGPGGFTKSTQCTGQISAAGTYNLTITDANGCQSSCSRTLTVNENPTCSITGTNVICQKDAQGNTNTTEFCGPAGMTTYAWTGPGNFTKATQCTGAISTAGTYNLTVTDGNGCSTSCSRTLTVNTNPSVVIASVACDLDGSIVLDATPSGGSGTYTYLWSTTATSQDITVTSPGTYTLVVTDSNGCVAAQASIRVGLCAGP
jgi:hypothetical protein